MILFLEPYFEKKPWAGDKLKTIYDCPDGTGEAWIVSGYIKKSSKVKYGRYKGETLRHLWRKHPELFGNYSDKEFPLLIKIIDNKIENNRDTEIEELLENGYSACKNCKP